MCRLSRSLAARGIRKARRVWRHSCDGRACCGGFFATESGAMCKPSTGKKNGAKMQRSNAGAPTGCDLTRIERKSAVIRMNSLVTVKLDPARAKKLSQWARRERKTKSDVLRELIDERQKIETGEDLSAFVREQWGKGFGHAGRG